MNPTQTVKLDQHLAKTERSAASRRESRIRRETQDREIREAYWPVPDPARFAAHHDALIDQATTESASKFNRADQLRMAALRIFLGTENRTLVEIAEEIGVSIADVKAGVDSLLEMIGADRLFRKAGTANLEGLRKKLSRNARRRDELKKYALGVIGGIEPRDEIEIAKELGVTRQAVNVAVQRLRKRLGLTQGGEIIDFPKNSEVKAA